MRVVALIGAGKDFEYKWPDGVHIHTHWVQYTATSPEGKHDVVIGFDHYPVYDRKRARAIVWIDGHNQVVFTGADDFEVTGEMLAEMRVRADDGMRICRYPEGPVPIAYSSFRVVGLPTRICAKGVHNSWAVITNISNHAEIISLAFLRRSERNR